MKIVFFEANNEEFVYFKKNLKGHQLKFFSSQLNEKNIKSISSCNIISAFIGSKVNSKILDKLPNLKLIITRSTGFDHIDIEECKKRGIKVSNAPLYAKNTVAEHAFALLLSLTRQLPIISNNVRRNKFSIKELKCIDLKGKTLGVIGVGRIGSNMIKIASGFQMKIIAHDIIKNKNLEKSIPFQYVSLDFLLRNSDIISLHIPLTKSTRHLINRSAFSKMKKSVFLINTSRGELIDNSSLLEALNNKKLSGLGLDVIEGEELLRNGKSSSILKEIIGHKNVIFTPHVAYLSNESHLRLLHETISIINKFTKNKHLSYIA